MSLYNAIFGVNPYTALLLQMLGTDIEQIPRFRDVYLDGDEIVIYTRTGGGNREHYEACSNPSNADLRKLPGFLRDEDDAFDRTFAYFHYRIPEDHRDAAQAVAKATEGRLKPREAWDALKSGENQLLNERAADVGEQIARQIEAGKTIIEV